MADFGFDSIPQAILERALQHNFSLEEKARRETAQLNKDFYYGKQDQMIKLLNVDQDPITVNFTKPIMHKRSTMLYPHPLVRTFDGPSKSVSFLEKVYKENSIDALLLQADLLSELTGSCLVFPFRDETLKNKMRLRLYDATQFSCVGADQDPWTADAISLVRVVDQLEDPKVRPRGSVQPDSTRVMEQQVWTATDVRVYSGEGMNSQLKGDFPNELGFLPFVNFKGEELHDQYIGFPPATHVQRLNAIINQILSHLTYMIKMQSGTPIVVSGFESGEPVVIHPGRALKVPANATATVLDLNPKIDETLRFINYLEEQMFATANVPRITIVGGQEGSMGRRASGRELLVRWFPLVQVFKEKCTRYHRYELQLANMILAIANLPEIEAVDVQWPEESLLPLSSESDELVQDLQIGVTTPVDEIIRRDPTLSKEEATELFVENLSVNALLPASPATAPIGPAQQNQQDLPPGPNTSNSDIVGLLQNG